MQGGDKMPIQVLDHETAAKIAAGEVITDPGAVIKELVENSIDAGSTRIDISIVDGGKKEITVMDNGSGIMSEEVSLAFERHATSKIHRLEDLYELNSLGFRGEALPSIAAISKVSVKTQSRKEDLGSYVRVDANKTHIIRRSFSPGTSISVEDIFYNTPARLKHMKKSNELSKDIIQLGENLALSHPDISFSLTVDGKTVLKTPGDDSLHNCIYSIFGSEFGDSLISIDYENKPLMISGFLGKSNYTKSSRKYQYTYINNRYVKDAKISRAIEEAYENSIMINQHPVFIVNINIPPHMLDVNVHPSKTKIKILNESLIFLLIKDGIRKTLRDNATVKEITPKVEKVYSEDKNIVQQEITPLLAQEAPSKVEVLPKKVTQKNSSSPELPKDTNIGQWKPQTKEKDLFLPIKEEKQKSKVPEDNSLPAEKPKINHEFADYFKHTNVVGQLFHTYILFEGEDYILLMDQHAAHERVLFENLSQKLKSGDKITQQVIPVNIKLPPSDYALLMNHVDVFENIGFEFDEFGDNTICLRGVPIFSNKVQDSSLLLEILQEVDKKVDIKKVDAFQELVIRIACKKAIKANKRLSPQEITSLIDSLIACDYPFTCPHGRPILVKLTKYEFEKQFKRIQ